MALPAAHLWQLVSLLLPKEREREREPSAYEDTDGPRRVPKLAAGPQYAFRPG